MVIPEYEEVTHTVTEKVIKSRKTYCDICGEEIIVGDCYWTIFRDHSNWGNDSIASHEYYDACSEKCVTSLFNDYMRESCAGFNTKEFQVTRCVNNNTV